MLEKVTEEQKKGGAACIIPSDDEIFAIAEQYYLDEDIKIDGNKFDNVRIVSASATSFTDEEKQKMRQEAIKKYQDDVIAEQKKKDQERKNKAKTKEKKPTAPVLVPDTPSNDGDKPATKTETKAEEKPKAVQMDLFG
jgi:FtsZ-interacting cell division protein ZipA